MQYWEAVKNVYEDFFKEMEWRYRDKVSVSLGFIPELSRKIYAGADYVSYAFSE